MTRRQRQAKSAAEHRWMRDRLLRLHDGASDATREAGRNWYPSAESAIATLADGFAVGPVAAAEMAGEYPRDLQAICWLAVRPAAEHDRDVRHLLGLGAV